MEWEWANEPRPGRLRAFWYSRNELIFDDRDATEQVMVTMIPGTGIAFNGIPALDGRHFVKGEGLTERDVWHVITREHCKALRAGLTVHRSVYSSTPHDFELSPVKGFEEVFLFLLPDGGEAILKGQGLWPDGSAVDEVWRVRDRQLAQIPMGRHPVSAQLCDDGKIARVKYIWCYICDRPEWEKD